MKYAESVIDLIGNTPLVKLNKVTDGLQATVLVKVEYLNPGGSSKDRIATRIIDAAERSGALAPGGTIVEPTSGNTGVGLALVAQQRGYRCVFVLPDKVGDDKRNVLLAYGAEIVVTPTSVAPEDPRSYYSVSDRLAREIPGAFKPDQYSNPNGPLSHYETTGPEIWRDTDGKVTHFVAGVGTGGTISGTGKYLKEVSDGHVVIVGADPVGSVYSGGSGRPYLVEGVGEDFWPSAYDPTVVDDIIAVEDAAAFEMTQRLAREEGLLVGGSSGMAVAGALDYAKQLPADAIVVVLLPDGGRGYLGKVFNEDWMAQHGFSEAKDGSTARDVLEEKTGEIPPLVHAHPENSVREVIDTMIEYGVTQLPVLSAELPVVLGDVLGALSESELADLLFSNKARPDDPVQKFIGPPLALAGINQGIDELYAICSEKGPLLVLDGGKPVGVITRTDIMKFLGS